ncbi:thiamine pyrophosphate-dependent enzyme [Mycobacterium marinum]|uniref:thiamine pyrophosphate-dependent enzyme n=1 Tax=Mycobacterium marinum TaxID=1781 RepID=UPI0003F9BC00|nr:thiamine pyrophosphate-dependent enzyme [Mycobacterium marinum]
MSPIDAARVYRMMVRMRLAEEALVEAWQEGLVPGEYHSAIGEEGIVAGILTQLFEFDTLALDHRNTAPLVGRGIDLQALMLEVLGSDQGIASGMAGHMHIFDPDLRAGADGIVGAAGPLAVGHAIAHTQLHPGSVAIAFHGEAAMNQGMLMEAYNMAVAWNLPVVFVCKDNKWGIKLYEGIASGMAGHMHIFDPDLRAGADGIVGAAGPLAVGHAIAHTQLHPGSVAIAFHGEAAMNQGMLMEAYNMAVAWNLPVVFVCKDNKWGITTYSKDQTGADPISRARGFGLEVASAAGHKVADVHAAAGRLIERARSGNGPGFLYVTCHRPGGHFEGDPLVGLLRAPRKQLSVWVPELRSGLTATESGSRTDKLRAMAGIGKRAARFAYDVGRTAGKDPVRRGRSLISADAATAIEAQERAEVLAAMTEARARVGKRAGFGIKTGADR